LITPTITILFNFIAITLLGIEPVTFWLVAQCLNRAPTTYMDNTKIKITTYYIIWCFSDRAS